ncbi:MAG: hypothetical protein NC489_45740 [Ruminococcus flavefaciens]|nr:hypothetical protein [Ruminococcus flavefaciens]
MGRNKCSYHGVINGYDYNELSQILIIYVSTDKGNEPVPEFSFRIKFEHLSAMLADLPIFRGDGSLDYMSVEGLPVYLNVRKIGGRSYVRKIKFDAAYFFSEG